MKALLLAALFCSILLSVCGQENDQWKRMKTGSRSFRNGNSNSVDNTEGVTKSRSNGRRQMFRKQGNGQDGTADGAQNVNRGNGRWQRPSRNRKSDWMVSAKTLHLWCFFVFVCLFGVLRPTREFFTHMETSPLPVKAADFDLCSALMAIEQ